MKQSDFVTFDVVKHIVRLVFVQSKRSNQIVIEIENVFFKCLSAQINVEASEAAASGPCPVGTQPLKIN